MRAGRRVVVTGLGVVTPYGAGVNVFTENLKNGISGASRITSFDVSGLPTQFAAQVPLSESQLDGLLENSKSLKTMCRASKFAMIAALEAVHDSGLDPGTLEPMRFGTSLGASGFGNWDLDSSSELLDLLRGAIQDSNRPDHSRVWRALLEKVHPLSPLLALPNIMTAHLAIRFNARGNCQTISTACTSSAQAIGDAYRLIRYGKADIMLTGGSDSTVNPYGLIAFSMLGVLSRNNREYQNACRPFDRRRDGFLLGEGAAILLLEEWEHCSKRGATPYAEVIGYASACDAYRLTDEPPEAWGTVAAIKGALRDAELHPENVDYVNAHGTGTPMNDKTETLAIRKVFGEFARTLEVSSTKSMIGHFVSAAGAVECAACLVAMKNRFVPPTINYQEPDPDCDLDYVPNHARDGEVNVALSNSFGFGGQNACLILRRIP